MTETPLERWPLWRRKKAATMPAMLFLPLTDLVAHTSSRLKQCCTYALPRFPLEWNTNTERARNFINNQIKNWPVVPTWNQAAGDLCDYATSPSVGIGTSGIQLRECYAHLVTISSHGIAQSGLERPEPGLVVPPLEKPLAENGLANLL
jgi:hypothetical protein